MIGTYKPTGIFVYGARHTGMVTTNTNITHSTGLQMPRLVKCPTPQCPGWITLDNSRHQTEPCRYCRIGVDTLRFLLSRIGAAPENKALPADVHDEFNRLMLAMAGAWGQNVYLRPSTNTLVDMQGGAHGVVIEYNPQLGTAGADGPAPLVGIILHRLLHFEAHLGHRPPQIAARSGARDKEGLVPLLSYLIVVADHAWVNARLTQLNPLLHNAQSRWGLDLAQMLVGAESMFNRYLSERNLNRLVGVLRSTANPDEFRATVIERLAALTSQILEREKEETRRIYVAIQLANARLLNPDAFPTYQQALAATGLSGVREAQLMAERLHNELSDSPITSPPRPQARAGEAEIAQTVPVDPVHYHKAVEACIRALGLGNFFEVKV
jgi:hypothetical protein